MGWAYPLMCPYPYLMCTTQIQEGESVILETNLSSQVSLSVQSYRENILNLFYQTTTTMMIMSRSRTETQLLIFLLGTNGDKS